MIARLSAQLSTATVENRDRVADLDLLIRESRLKIHRRAEHIERDGCCYRTGGALEPYGGHRLDSIKLSGWDALGEIGTLLLARTGLDHPGLSNSERLQKLFGSAHGELIREWGAWSRWHWLSALYNDEVSNFVNSRKGYDKLERWRTKAVTSRQRYLVEEIALIANEQVPTFATRGEAFEFILVRGGNPRFRQAPPRPQIPRVGL